VVKEVFQQAETTPAPTDPRPSKVSVTGTENGSQAVVNVTEEALLVVGPVQLATTQKVYWVLGNKEERLVVRPATPVAEFTTEPPAQEDPVLSSHE
jgi:hypothetical protein